MRTPLTMMSLLLAGLTGACADGERGALVDPAMADGKADASERVILLGPVGFGAPVAGAFREDLEWHGYTLAIRPDAVVTLDITQKGSSRSVDTTLYVYGPKNEFGAYGSAAAAFDDDAGWGRLSRLSKQRLPGGEWLVVVGTRDGRGRGAYRLEARCESGECEPLPVVPAGACHPAIRAGIEACVASWLADPDFDPSTMPRDELIAQCADAEPMAPVRDRLCASADAPAGLCALDMEAFHLSYLPGCRHEVLGRHLDESCVFGERYRDIKGRAEAIVVLGERRLTDPSELTPLEQEQVVAAVRATAYDGADTVEAAFAAVDDNEVNQLELWDASSRKAYTAYEVGAGDNSFGMVFAYGTTQAVARNNDGDWYDCTVTWGHERRRCEGDAQCQGGARCIGASESARAGRCVAPQLDTAPDEGSDCTVSDGASSCPGGSGLVCAGAALDGAGMCLPAWMRGRFDSTPALSIPDKSAAGASAQLLVYGLATVDMDVRIDLLIAHPRTTDLRVTLTNPAGNEVLVFDGEATAASTEIHLAGQALRGFSGDEQVNGIWTLRAVDARSGQTGSIERFGLEITSRWD